MSTRYILLKSEDVANLKAGEEVYCALDGTDIALMLEDAYKAAYLGVTDEEWKKAIEHLDMLILLYAGIGPTGFFGLSGVLAPLKARYEKGERTKELYDAIMACE